MSKRMIVLSAAVAALWTSAASAAMHAQQPAPPRPEPKLVQLAQAGDVEIYYDEFGRRVMVDSYTGEVLSVERPRRENRRPLRELRRERQDRYYLDDPDDMERLEQDRASRMRAPQPGEGEYYDFSDQDFGAVPEQDFPEAPRRRESAEEPPQTVEREPVQRAPLGVPAPRPVLPDVSEPEPATTASTEPATGSVQPLTPGAVQPGVVQPGAAQPDIIEQATVPPLSPSAREDVAALQVLLDRKGASPGVIDGRFGSNVDRALETYRSITGENLKSTDAAAIKAALAASGGDAFTSYTISPEDAAGPYVASVPEDYGAKAKLERLAFTSVPEMLAERFHMDEKYLRAINPEANFNRPGTIVKVASIGQNVTAKVTRIVADKPQNQVFAYDAGGKLVASYPATIGSSDTPSPSGTHAVSRVALNPEYTYNPKINFKQGQNDKILTIPPGPNGPVGSVWIALDKPTYGVHGTPEPSKIGKTESHGCVRLTNWDAAELAKLVTAGVPVKFVE